MATAPTSSPKPSRLPASEMQACIDACHACAEACEQCASSCLSEPNVAHMQRCIQRDWDCADLCQLARRRAPAEALQKRAAQGSRNRQYSYRLVHHVPVGLDAQQRRLQY